MPFYYAWAVVSQGFYYEPLVKFYTETCWVHCSNICLTHQGCSQWFMMSNLARPVEIHMNAVHDNNTSFLDMCKITWEEDDTNIMLQCLLIICPQCKGIT